MKQIVLLFFAVTVTFVAYAQGYDQLPESEKPYMSVEQMPMFEGGDKALSSFIKNNLKYPDECIKDSIEGRVVVRFVVERDGSLTDIKVLRMVEPLIDEEAVRIIKSMPHWIPGKQNGELVRVYYTLPIIFKMPKDNLNNN